MGGNARSGCSVNSRHSGTCLESHRVVGARPTRSWEVAFCRATGFRARLRDFSDCAPLAAQGGLARWEWQSRPGVVPDPWGQVSRSTYAGRGGSPAPGSLGEAANGGLGQAGLRPRVPNEPGHSSPAGQEPLPVRTWRGGQRPSIAASFCERRSGTMCACCKPSAKSFSFDSARCRSSPAGAGRGEGTCSLA